MLSRKNGLMHSPVIDKQYILSIMIMILRMNCPTLYLLLADKVWDN